MESTKKSPVHSWPRVKILMLHHLCENPCSLHKSIAMITVHSSCSCFASYCVAAVLMVSAPCSEAQRVCEPHSVKDKVRDTVLYQDVPYIVTLWAH